MLNKIIQFFQNLENREVSKSAIKRANTIFNINDNGVIEISGFESGFIPNRLKLSKTTITNTEFKSIRLLENLTSDQVFYLNSLDFEYARQFKDREFLELQTIKLYLDLCEQTDIYLKNKGSSLEKRAKKMERGYMGYNNTFYSLYFVSEFNVEQFYFGRSRQSTSYSFGLLKEQIDSKIINYLQQYLALRLPKLPPVSSESLIKNIYNNLNSYQTLGLAFKRLELDEKQKYYLEIIPFNKNIFTEINQCLDQIILLYLKSVNFVLERSRQYDIKSVLNALNLNAKKTEYGMYVSSVYDSAFSKILQAIFSICQNRIKEVYKHSKLEDVTYEKSYLTKKLGKQIKQDFEQLLAYYQPQKPTKSTQIKLNTKNKANWKIDLKQLLEGGLKLVELKQKCDELLELNSKNPNQYLIYLELCRQFAKKSKTASLWYYYKYHDLLTFKNSSNLNLSEPKPLPVSVVKIIFGTDQEKLKKFEFIYKTINPLTHSDEFKKKEIKDLFRVKRKELKLDLLQTEKAHQTHSEMTSKLNQVLQKEEILDSSQNVYQEMISEIDKLERDKQEATVKINIQPDNLRDFFTSDSSSDNQSCGIDFTEIESEFLSLFKENQFELTDSQISDFAKSKKQFKNSLIQKINQKFYETFEDNLIEQEDEKYLIYNYNQKLI